jgi:hypothetical protein
VLTLEGERRQAADDVEQGRPVVALDGGGTPVLDWRREEAEDAQLDATELLDSSASTAAVRAVESCGGGALAMAGGALQAVAQTGGADIQARAGEGRGGG